MKFRAFLLICITSVVSLYCKEDKNISLGFGFSSANPDFMLYEDPEESYSLLLDLAAHSDIFIGYEFYCFENKDFTLRTELTFLPLRVMADLSLTLNYREGMFQFYLGPNIAYDEFFPHIRTLTNIALVISDKDPVGQDFWVYAGFEAGCRFHFTDFFGMSIESKNSFADISHLFTEVDKDYIDGFNLFSISLFFRL